jgi:hypothetical protein
VVNTTTEAVTGAIEVVTEVVMVNKVVTEGDVMVNTTIEAVSEVIEVVIEAEIAMEILKTENFVKATEA